MQIQNTGFKTLQRLQSGVILKGHNFTIKPLILSKLELKTKSNDIGLQFNYYLVIKYYDYGCKERTFHCDLSSLTIRCFDLNIINGQYIYTLKDYYFKYNKFFTSIYQFDIVLFYILPKKNNTNNLNNIELNLHYTL